MFIIEPCIIPKLLLYFSEFEPQIIITYFLRPGYSSIADDDSTQSRNVLLGLFITILSLPSIVMNYKDLSLPFIVINTLILFTPYTVHCLRF